MKKTFYISSSLFFLFFTQIIFSQKTEENFLFKNYSSSVFGEKDAGLNLLTSSNRYEGDKNFYNKIQNSGIAIQQVGNYNDALVDVKSKTTSISIIQNGNNNEYLLVKEATNIAIDINQNGNSNKINDYSYRTNYDVNTQMIQNGNNQNIKSIGTNSISKDMKVTQIGNGASVIILNKLN